jgi:hypothetical protein
MPCMAIAFAMPRVSRIHQLRPSYSIYDLIDQLPVFGLAPLPGLLAQTVIDY